MKVILRHFSIGKNYGPDYRVLESVDRQEKVMTFAELEKLIKKLAKKETWNVTIAGGPQYHTTLESGPNGLKATHRLIK